MRNRLPLIQDRGERGEPILNIEPSRHSLGYTNPTGILGPRIAGALLVAGLVVGVLSLGLLIIDDAMPAFSALRRGSLEALAPHVPTFRLSTILYAAAWTAQLLGFALLTRMLVRSGNEQLAVMAMAAITVAAVLGMLEASFGFMVTPWAAGEAATSGIVPSIYPVLRRWVDGMQALYLALGLLAQAGFGAALLSSELLPSWVGRAALVWALIWLPVLGMGIPAILFLMPAMIGAALLSR